MTVFGAFWGRSRPVLGMTGHFPRQAMARGVWYLAHAVAVAATVVGATNVQVGALVSTASLEHSNPFQVPLPGTRRTGNKQKRRGGDTPLHHRSLDGPRRFQYPLRCTITTPSEGEN
jgi:hypothetical protein